ncbi:NlpC/P60 family protein [Nitrospira sp. T9]|uniref:NlpC/P60 family protein n=1 Tax=unclassified Nitrospira TaxID=2652172 RepID=UPI003F9BFF69
MSETLFDWNQWIGLPFRTRGRGPDRYDCYGLVRAVLLDAKGIPLPAFLDDETPIDSEAHDHLERWVLVDVPHPIQFDILHFQMPSRLPHLGLAVDNVGLFLHATMGSASHVERLCISSWRCRLRGIYRYGGMAQE